MFPEGRDILGAQTSSANNFCPVYGAKMTLPSPIGKFCVPQTSRYHLVTYTMCTGRVIYARILHMCHGSIQSQKPNQKPNQTHKPFFVVKEPNQLLCGTK